MKKRFLSRTLAFVSALTCSASALVMAPAAVAEDNVKYEFEEGVLVGATVPEPSSERYMEGASGDSFVFLKDGGETASVTVNVDSTGMYDIILGYSAPYGSKIHNLIINDIDQGQISLTSEEWTEAKLLTAKLDKGENVITVKSGWGWSNLDYLAVKAATLPDITVFDRTPCDPDATDSAKKLMAYLSDTYGNNILSGQQEIYNYGPHDFDWEFNYINEKTGKFPAIRAVDYLNAANPLYGSDDGTSKRAIEWVNDKGGIATASWHITVPRKFESYVLKETKVDWSQATYKPDETDFDTSKAIVEGTKEHDYYMWCLELLASEIQKLQDADVPLIFRPLHEAEGGGGETGSWFWWGKSGSAVYKELWKLTYKTLTETYGLHNIIWEWNSYAYETSADWYPGDDYVDIIAYDKYNCTDWSTGSPVLGHNDSAISGTFYSIVEKFNGKKMVAMAENDSIPTLKNLLEEKAAWLYFCPWYDGANDNEKFLTNPVFNKLEDLIEIYKSDYCITLDELPDLKTYEAGTVTPPKPTEPPTTAATTTSTVVTTTTTLETSATTETTIETEPTEPTTSTTVSTSSNVTTESVPVTNANTTLPSTEPVTDPATTTTTAPPATTTTTTTTQEITEPPTTLPTGAYDVPDGVKPSILGDVNTDGLINIADVVKLNKFLLNNKDNPLEPVEMANADCIKNGKVEAADSTYLMSFVAMVIDKLED